MRKHILIPVNGSDNSLNAVRAAIAAYRHDESARLHIVNVQPLFNRHISRWVSRRARDAFRQERSLRALGAAQQMISRTGMRYSTYVMNGPIARAVADLAQELNCSEIILGASPQGALNRFLTNSLATRLLDISVVPVKIIPGDPLPLARRVALPVGLGLALLLLSGD